MGLQRADENLDVRILHVRVLAGSIFVVWVPGSMAPRLLELLPDMFQRVDHDAELIEPLFGDGTAEELLVAQVHLLEHVVPRDVPAGAPCHRCRPVLVPNATDRRTHHVNCGSLLYAVCSVLVLVCGTEQRGEIAPRPIERLVVVTADRVADREPRKQELVEEPHQDAKTKT